MSAKARAKAQKTRAQAAPQIVFRPLALALAWNVDGLTKTFLITSKQNLDQCLGFFGSTVNFDRRSNQTSNQSTYLKS